MEVVLIILAGLCFYGCIKLHKSADKSEKKFANRPRVISNPAIDLYTDQKFAIIRLYIFVMGSDERLALSSYAENFMENELKQLGLTVKDAERIMKADLSRGSVRVIDGIISSLAGIRDFDYLKRVEAKCKTLISCSNDNMISELIDKLFSEVYILHRKM